MSLIALWDLGNVVVQWNPQRIRELTGLSDSKTAVFKTPFFEELWLDLDRGIRDEPEVASLVASQTDVSIEEVELYFECVRTSLVDSADTVRLIKEMKEAGIRMYVLSNMSLVNSVYLRQREYFRLFDGVVISAEEKLIKPEIDLFTVLLERYELDPKQLVFMDDSLPNIQAAQSLGMQGVHFKASSDCYKQIRQHFNLNTHTS